MTKYKCIESYGNDFRKGKEYELTRYSHFGKYALEVVKLTPHWSGILEKRILFYNENEFNRYFEEV